MSNFAHQKSFHSVILIRFQFYIFIAISDKLVVADFLKKNRFLLEMNEIIQIYIRQLA